MIFARKIDALIRMQQATVDQQPAIEMCDQARQRQPSRLVCRILKAKNGNARRIRVRDILNLEVYGATNGKKRCCQVGVSSVKTAIV
jgi:hypothetical protein